MSNKNTHEVPSSKLLADLIDYDEVPALILNEENAVLSLDRRLAKEKARKERNATTRFIALVGVMGASAVALGLGAIHYNREHPIQHTPIEHSDNGAASNNSGDSDSSSAS